MLINRLKNDHKAELNLNDIQRLMINQINQKVKDNIYCFEELLHCPVCESHERTLVGEKDRYGLYYPVVICNSCGLLYANPRMTQESYNTFYNLEYRKLYIGEKKLIVSIFECNINMGRKYMNIYIRKKLLEENH